MRALPAGAALPPERLDLRIVDNGSTDGTDRGAARLRRAGSRCCTRGKGRGGGPQRRCAGSAAEVIAFTDADCIVDPGWLGALVPALADESVGIAGGAILATTPANDVARFGEVVHDHRRAIEATDPPYAITMNWASRRRVPGSDRWLRRPVSPLPGRRPLISLGPGRLSARLRCRSGDPAPKRAKALGALPRGVRPRLSRRPCPQTPRRFPSEPRSRTRWSPPPEADRRRALGLGPSAGSLPRPLRVGLQLGEEGGTAARLGAVRAPRRVRGTAPPSTRS